MAKLIELTQEKFAIVDDEDYEYLMQHKWHYSMGYASAEIYISPTKRKRLKMHRVIMKPPDHLVVDHINHDTLDNRKENLRICTKQQNEMNQKIRINKESKYKGVNKRYFPKR